MVRIRKFSKSVSMSEKTERQAEDLAENHGYSNVSSVVVAGIQLLWVIEHQMSILGFVDSKRGNGGISA